MTCDTCKRPINYVFYINDEHWYKAVGKKEGYRCAHCILETLGGLHWVILWDERSERRMRDDTPTSEYVEALRARFERETGERQLEAKVPAQYFGKFVRWLIAKHKQLEVNTMSADRKAKDALLLKNAVEWVYSEIGIISMSQIWDAVERTKMEPLSRALQVCVQLASARPEGGVREARVEELERAIRVCNNVERTHEDVEERIGVVRMILDKYVDELRHPNSLLPQQEEGKP